MYDSEDQTYWNRIKIQWAKNCINAWLVGSKSFGQNQNSEPRALQMHDSLDQTYGNGIKIQWTEDTINVRCVGSDLLGQNQNTLSREHYKCMTRRIKLIGKESKFDELRTL